MKLNPDCIRAILMYSEDHTTVSDTCSFDFEKHPDELFAYTNDEILHHLRQCNESGFFIGFKEYISGDVVIRDISPRAHEFLANIRKDTIWNGVKGVATKIGSVSLNALIQIASNVVTELIKAQFGLSGAASF